MIETDRGGRSDCRHHRRRHGRAAGDHHGDLAQRRRVGFQPPERSPSPSSGCPPRPRPPATARRRSGTWRSPFTRPSSSCAARSSARCGPRRSTSTVAGPSVGPPTRTSRLRSTGAPPRRGRSTCPERRPDRAAERSRPAHGHRGGDRGHQLRSSTRQRHPRGSRRDQPDLQPVTHRRPPTGPAGWRW